MDESLVYWLGLARVEGLGVRSAHKLIDRLGSPQAAYMASLTELETSGLPAPVCQAIFAQTGLKEAEKEIEAAGKLGCPLRGRRRIRRGRRTDMVARSSRRASRRTGRAWRQPLRARPLPCLCIPEAASQGMTG